MTLERIAIPAATSRGVLAVGGAAYLIGDPLVFPHRAGSTARVVPAATGLTAAP